MERLTERKRNFDGTGVAIKEITDGLLTPFAGKILTKLADYEDLEEQGLLLRLPVSKDKMVYHVKYRWTKCVNYEEEYPFCENYNCDGYCDSKKEYYIQPQNLIFQTICFLQNEIGKTVFLTREEAEKKLKELNNEA